MTTPLNAEGLLDYGDNDGSVIWRSPLTSEASISTPDIGGGTYAKVGTGQLFDATKGLLCGAAGHYTVTAPTDYAKLTFSGQLCFDVETDMIACSNADSEGSSGGREQTANEVFLGFLANPGTSANYSWYVNVSAKLLGLAVGYGTGIVTASNKSSDAIGKTQFTTIHVAWNGNVHYFYVNKVLQDVITRPANIAFPFYKLVLGRYPYSSAVPLISGYIRNLQISTRPLSLSVPPVLSRGQAFGDSYADGVHVSQTGTWDMEKALVLEKELISVGMKFGDFSSRSYGGRKVIGSGNAALYLIDNIATALLDRPTLVIFQGGANDLTTDGTLDTAAFTLAMKAIIEQFFGLNGNTATTVQRMLICSTPWAPEYPTVAQALLRQPDITSIAAIQASLPAWFDAAYPALVGRLEYQDTFGDFGGFDPDTSYYLSADLVHPSPKGRYVMGKSWARGVKKLLRT